MLGNYDLLFDQNKPGFTIYVTTRVLMQVLTTYQLSKKIFTFNYKEKVYITILASGNLATTQFLVNSLNDIFREKNKEKAKFFGI